MLNLNATHTEGVIGSPAGSMRQISSNNHMISLRSMPSVYMAHILEASASVHFFIHRELLGPALSF